MAIVDITGENIYIKLAFSIRNLQRATADPCGVYAVLWLLCRLFLLMVQAIACPVCYNFENDMPALFFDASVFFPLPWTNTGTALIFPARRKTCTQTEMLQNIQSVAWLVDPVWHRYINACILTVCDKHTHCLSQLGYL